eukprot:UN24945
MFGQGAQEEEEVIELEPEDEIELELTDEDSEAQFLPSPPGHSHLTKEQREKLYANHEEEGRSEVGDDIEADLEPESSQLDPEDERLLNEDYDTDNLTIRTMSNEDKLIIEDLVQAGLELTSEEPPPYNEVMHQSQNSIGSKRSSSRNRTPRKMATSIDEDLMLGEREGHGQVDFEALVFGVEGHGEDTTAEGEVDGLFSGQTGDPKGIDFNVEDHLAQDEEADNEEELEPEEEDEGDEFDKSIFQRWMS